MVHDEPPEGTAPTFAEQDVTALRAERDHLLGILESMFTGYVVFDRNWRYTYVNALAERLLGAPRQELLGRVVWEKFPAAVGSDFERVFRRAMEQGTAEAFDAYYPAPLNVWFELRVQGLPDGLAVYFLDINARRVAQDEAVAARQQAEVISARLGALTEVILELNGAQTEGELSQLIVERGLARLGATGGSVSLLAEDDTALRALISDALGAGAQAAYTDLPADSPLPAAVTARTGEEILLPDREAAVGFSPQMAAVCDETGCVGWACLPLLGSERRLGALVAAWEQPHEVDAAERQVLRVLAQQCAHSLDRLRERDADSARSRYAITLAETLQRSLLTEPIATAGIRLETRYRAAAAHAQIGGDWFDSFRNGQGQLCLVVGDATGHDKNAAAIMGQVRNLLRGVAYTVGEPPAAVLGRLDRAMHDLQVDSLATVVFAVLDEQEGRDPVLHFSNAGHPPPLLLQPGHPPRLLGQGDDLLLGVDGTTVRTNHQQALPAGSTVLLYTDGLVERRGASIDDGLGWLQDAAAPFSAAAPDQLCDALLAAVADADDDIALLAFQVEGEPAPPG